MLPRFIKLFLALLAFLAILPAQVVRADTGPKPTMEFEFSQEGIVEPITITSGVFYECDQADCSDAAPLQERGPQRFTCEAGSCRALAYGFSQYHRIEIQFSDGKTRQSNIFQTAGFDSRYTVTIRPDDLLVEAQFSLGVFPPIVPWILITCCCAVIIIGLIVGLIIFVVRRSRKS